MDRLDLAVLAAARQHPARMAVEDPDRGTTLTYAALRAVMQRAAEHTAALGVQPGDRVGICAPKTMATVAALLGTMQAGAAYVPVDATAPAARNAFIFQDCQVRGVWVDRALLPALRAAYGAPDTPDLLPVVHELGDAEALGADLVLVQAPAVANATEPPEGLSYILYTSGSTGTPKGVMHTHASALSFVRWCADVFRPTPADRFSSHAPFHFDLSILDLYVPLMHGATLVLISEALGKHPQRLGPAIAESGITAWYSTPSVLRLLVEYGKMEDHDYSALRIVNFAGEVFPTKHLRALKTRWPEPRYFNLYGPTETNVCTYLAIPAAIPEARTDPFPIGGACSGDRCRVVDADYIDVPAGTPGELIVHGGSVMQGYWNLPDRNANAFVTDDAGKTWYKTGDIVVDDGAGCYTFVGRRDRMVKRRGYRVELGEIESALYRHPSVSEAAAIAVHDEANDVVIKAYVAWQGDKKPSVLQMKPFCAKHLPRYMIPDRFVFEAALPKTSTDKIDYQALKARG